MKIKKTYFRMYVSNLDEVLPYYEKLLGIHPDLRFKYPEMHLELASIGDFLFVAGKSEDLKTFNTTKVTFMVDALDDFLIYFEQNNFEIIREPRIVPTGKNVTVRHPDGLIAEYVEHQPDQVKSVNLTKNKSI
ncbi:VOC family protein [Sporolactobacillus shoreicorticis]|uniref:VOC family protein n=1 Tax=Sporolactobacillus shoreicorticis TaxID=1923877 RepID=A0ABW5SAK0_9BACL|nr:VOC family protein [Sporolactobacillus shoreicorticis]MCO7125507.1 VOC family protein [Sporolactobacillus shoreicorticis]